MEQVCLSIDSHTLKLVCEISANNKEYYYIAEMLCERKMDIYLKRFFSCLYAKYF